MADPSADRPLPFTDQDVDLLDHALVDADCRHGAIGPGHVGCTLACSRCIARKALEALAAAGRLAPVSAEHRWAVTRDGMTFPMYSYEEAVAWVSDDDRKGWRILTKIVGPWVEADENTGGTE